MASPVLHIKDSYYFEVPKFWKPTVVENIDELPDFVVRLDGDYLAWQAKQVLPSAIRELSLKLPPDAELLSGYQHWLHDHANVGKPILAYLQSAGHLDSKNKSLTKSWEKLVEKSASVEAYKETAQWSEAKLADYGQALSGKILLYPQPFGELKNLYEPASGFCISKYMIIELIVALLLGVVFVNLANHMRTGGVTRGRFWNALEAMSIYMRDHVARPAIGKKDADKFVPLLWTIFFFVLVCNLMGLIPWLGAPTSAFGATLGLALVTLFTGIIMGSKKFGVIGYWKNQVPSMDLPIYMTVILKPMLWLIEVAGLLIKHGILAVRLLANMVAGHLVLLAIMTMAFSVEGAMSDSWWVAAPIAVIGSTIFSMLELFVAFLQAYIFTFLSALFIGAAVHHH